MATRTVTGTLKDSQDRPLPNTVGTFSHEQGAYTPTATYPKPPEVPVVTDADGHFSVELVAGLHVKWRFRFGTESFTFALPDGGPISIEQLRAISGTPQPAQTPLDAEAAARTAADADLQAQINGLVIGGGGDKTYRHVQGTPASVWTVLHSLGKYVSVSVVDSTGDLVLSDVQYDSPNQVTLTFSAAFGGEAYCN